MELNVTTLSCARHLATSSSLSRCRIFSREYWTSSHLISTCPPCRVQAFFCLVDAKGQHSVEVRITVVIYPTMTKLNEDCEKETQAAGQTVEQDTQQTVAKRERRHRDERQKPLLSCKLFRRKASCYCACHPHYWGTQTDFHVSALCVEDPVHHRRQPPTPSIDATIRRHPSKHPTTPPIDATIRCHQSPTTS